MQRPKAILFVEHFEEHPDKKEVVKEAERMGFSTLVFTKKKTAESEDLYDHALEVVFHDSALLEASLRDLSKHFDIQAVVSNYESYVIYRAFLAEKLNIPSASIHASALTRNKALLRRFLLDTPFHIPFFVVDNFLDARKAFQDLGKDAYLKPLAGVKSRFVHHVTDSAVLEEGWKYFHNHVPTSPERYEDFSFLHLPFEYPNPRNFMLLEKSLYGHQVASACFINHDSLTHMPSVTDVYPAVAFGIPDSFLAFRILPSKISGQQQQEVEEALETILLESLKLSFCSVHAELMLTKEQEIKVIEIASRLGGYRPLMYQEVYGLDLNRYLLESVLGRDLSIPRSAPKKYVSVLEIFPRENGTFERVEGFEELSKTTDISHIHLRAVPGQSVGLARDDFPPVLSFLISGSSYSEVYEKSISYQQSLRVRLRQPDW